MTSQPNSGTEKRAASRLFVGAASGLVNAIGSIVAVAVFGRYFIRVAGLESYGAWSIVPFLGGLQTLFDFGFARESVLRMALGADAQARSRHVGSLFWYSLASALLAAGTSTVFLWAGLGDARLLGREALLSIWLASSLSALALGMLTFVRAVAEACNQIALVNFSLLAQTVFTYLLAAAAVYVAPGGRLVYFSYPAALALVLLGFLPLCSMIQRKGGISAPVPRHIWGTFRVATGHGWAGAMSFVVLPLNRAFILRHEDSLAVYAVFDLISKIAESAAFVLTSAFTPLYRHFLEPSAQRERRRILRSSERVAVAALLVGVAAYAVLAKPVLGYLLGPSGAGFVVVSVVIVGLRASHGVAEPSTRLLWASGNKSVVLWARSVALGLNLLLLTVLNLTCSLEWAAGLAYASPFLASGLLIRRGAREYAGRVCTPAGCETGTVGVATSGDGAAS